MKASWSLITTSSAFRILSRDIEPYFSGKRFDSLATSGSHSAVRYVSQLFLFFFESVCNTTSTNSEVYLFVPYFNPSATD